MAVSKDLMRQRWILLKGMLPHNRAFYSYVAIGKLAEALGIQYSSAYTIFYAMSKWVVGEQEAGRMVGAKLVKEGTARWSIVDEDPR